MVLLGCFVAQTRGVMFARAGDNVYSLCEGALQPVRSSCVEVGLSQTGVYTFVWVFRDQSHIYYKSVRYSA